ncbi:aminotransferase class V-fold PLP-dependent enzyme [Lederbergia lenta]|uniref:Acetyltransferase, GNAT family n=1 Tax=Lederbergia lenta TaxID=1467 RepID=A0A2X4W9A5_LEDLE|nr:aminotransferase class V-fold PLP-dependent enzyme [Lederbergia lenta]MCM3111030.1 aminotransferase class V-fold PLP-dependent enzyme [Lederbergia lenta]MEC2325582.1 aminotransferase class V-fold PLP-dependent enzyme [Lederbergia lenta]SQI54210.1 acetyltransferase, GNAT family [Lederbergia lenta]
MSFIYKIANQPAEFDQIKQLNYRTFVEEIPQHEKNDSHTLVDKFHDENTYIVCLKEGQVIGMICVRSNRPFSLDGKIGEIEQHLPVHVDHPCEIRLLAVDQKYRNGRVFLGIAQALIRFCLKLGYDAAVISGTTREQKLYGQMGFQGFAFLTGDEDAAFQPMYLTKATFDAGIAGRILKEQNNFLPGPATIPAEVQQALATTPYSHRSKEFDNLLLDVQMKLKKLVNANFVQLLHGTGTLANDVVTGQLSLLGGKGLILVNGEFGRRLVNHAVRFGLQFDRLEAEWGMAFTEDEIQWQVEKEDYRWIWAVHCETSTGILNDLEILKKISKQCGSKLAIDCISSIGTLPIDLDGVAFASGVSGKALASYTGLSFVFHEEAVKQTNSLPRYLDLGIYAESGGIPYTQSSNLVGALAAALKRYDQSEIVYDQMRDRFLVIRKGLEEIGFSVLANEGVTAPTILTISPPEGECAKQLGDNLYLNGFSVHYESSYLQEKNWLQISCINEVKEKEIDRLLRVMKGLRDSNRQIIV